MNYKIISTEPVLTIKNKTNVKLIIELVDVYFLQNMLIFKEYIVFTDENGKEQKELYRQNYPKKYTELEFSKLLEYSKTDFDKTSDLYIDNFKRMFDFLLLFVNQIDPPYNIKLNSFEKY